MERLVKTLAFILRPFNIAVRQCGWCKRILGFKRHVTGVTTGMCRACYNREVAK